MVDDQIRNDHVLMPGIEEEFQGQTETREALLHRNPFFNDCMTIFIPGMGELPRKLSWK
jgi:hypothetical protein